MGAASMSASSTRTCSAASPAPAPSVALCATPSPERGRKFLLLPLPRLENLAPGRVPHAAVAQDVIQRILDRLNAMRHAGEPRPQRQSDDAAAMPAGLAIEQVEMVLHLLEILRRLVLEEVEDLQVADLEIGRAHV